MPSLPAEILMHIFDQFGVTNDETYHECMYYPRYIFDHPGANCSTDDETPDTYFPTYCENYQQLRHTLCSLCLTSRHFRELAQPILYHKLTFVYDGPPADPIDDPIDDAIRRWNAPLNSWMRTILERRDLAACVRRVAINAFAADRHWLACSSHAWAAIALVADKLPNLDHCSLDFDRPPPYLTETLRLSFRYSEKDRYRIPSSDYSLENLFGLAHDTMAKQQSAVSIRTLNIRWTSLFKLGKRYPKLKLRIETLRILQSKLCSREIRRLMSYCIGLKTFIFEASRPDGDLVLGRYGMYCALIFLFYLTGSCSCSCSYHLLTLPHIGDDFSFDPSTAIKLLASHQETLEELYLDLRYGKYFPDHPRPIESLKKFTLLKTLLIDSTAVCSRRTETLAHRDRLVQMLPSGLVTLRLVGCPGQGLHLFAEMFLQLAEAIRRGRFGALRRVRCDARDVFRPEDNSAFDDRAVAEKFAEVGVEFTYDRPELDERAGDLSYWDDPEVYPTIGLFDDRPWTALWNHMPRRHSSAPEPGSDIDEDS